MKGEGVDIHSEGYIILLSEGVCKLKSNKICIEVREII